MSDEERQDIRLQCLHLASKTLGECLDSDAILMAAEDYYDWTVGKKTELRVIHSNDDKVN